MTTCVEFAECFDWFSISHNLELFIGISESRFKNGIAGNFPKSYSELFCAYEPLTNRYSSTLSPFRRCRNFWRSLALFSVNRWLMAGKSFFPRTSLFNNNVSSLLCCTSLDLEMFRTAKNSASTDSLQNIFFVNYFSTRHSLNVCLVFMILLKLLNLHYHALNLNCKININ